jgi:hypothetical protein
MMYWNLPRTTDESKRGEESIVSSTDTSRGPASVFSDFNLHNLKRRSNEAVATISQCELDQTT